MTTKRDKYRRMLDRIVKIIEVGSNISDIKCCNARELIIYQAPELLNVLNRFKIEKTK